MRRRGVIRGDAPLAVLALALAAAAVGVGGGAAGQRARAEVEMPAQAGMTRAQQTRLDQMASASLFGQFRSNMADFLYLKVDKYLHNGVELRGLTPEEAEASAGKDEEEGHHEGHGDGHDEEEGQHGADEVRTAASDLAQGFQQHAEETTVVPSKRRDWRGILGDLEREVQPYEDMSAHTHRDAQEALPLFRLMTISNPNFIPGYTLGATMIARDRAKTDEALAFLKEGERNNPQSIEIKMELGRMTTARKRDFAGAVPYLLGAIQIGHQRDPKTLTEDEDEALRDAYRWLVLNRREVKDHRVARAAARECLARYGSDVVCGNYLRDFPESAKPAR